MDPAKEISRQMSKVSPSFFKLLTDRDEQKKELLNITDPAKLKIGLPYDPASRDVSKRTETGCQRDVCVATPIAEFFATGKRGR